MYELKFDKKATDFLNKLEKEDKERIWDKLQQCKLNPFHYLKHLEEIKGFKLRHQDALRTGVVPKQKNPVILNKKL